MLGLKSQMFKHVQIIYSFSITSGHFLNSNFFTFWKKVLSVSVPTLPVTQKSSLTQIPEVLTVGQWGDSPLALVHVWIPMSETKQIRIQVVTLTYTEEGFLHFLYLARLPVKKKKEKKKQAEIPSKP